MNYSTLAVDCGITHNTAKAWLSVLEASYILFLLRPHHINFNKRLIKAPKLYFYDVGLASWLLGIRDPDQIETHPLRGNLFETFVVAEWVKSFRNRGEQTAFYFWRDSNGVEVDLLIEQGMRLMPVEIKSGKTVAHDFFASLNKWTELAGDLAEDPTMVYGGREDFRHKGIRIISWRHLGT